MAKVGEVNWRDIIGLDPVSANQGMMPYSPLLDRDQAKILEGMLAQSGEKNLVANPQVATPPILGNSFLNRLQVSGPLITPEERAQEADLRERFKRLQMEQEQGLARQGQYANDIKTTARPDLTGAALIADNVFGGNFTPAVRQWSGPSPQEQAKLLADIEAKQNAQRDQMQDAVQKMLGVQQSNRMLDLQNKNMRFAQGQDMRLNMAYNQELNKVTNPAMEVISSINAVEAATQPGADGMVDLSRVMSALSNAARLNGEKGVLTDQDTARQLQTTLDMQIANWSAYLQSNPGVKRVPAAQVAPLIAAMKDGKLAMGNAAKRRADATTQKFVQAYGMRPEVGMMANEQTMQPMLTEQFGLNQQAQTPPIPQTQTLRPGVMSREEFMKSRGK